MNVTVGISTFGRAATVLNTVKNLAGIPTLINVNDGNQDLHAQLTAFGCNAILADGPQLFWQGMTTLIRESVTDWVLVTSDEDPVIVEELPELERFADSKTAGVVATPVWADGFVKPWPSSWAERMSDENPLHPSHFHDISGYISGTLIHRPTALKYLPLINELAAENIYVIFYTIPALVALMGMSRDAYTYPNSVIAKGEALPTHQDIPGSDYWESASRRTQKQHFDEFMSIISDMEPEYGAKLLEAQVYEKRGWVS